MEKNKIELTGTIDRLQAVTTRTGKPMARFFLKCGQDSFKAVAFGNIATELLKLRDGDQVGVSGSGSINSWKDAEERWHNDFQVTCWSIEINEQVISYEKAAGREPVARPQSRPDQQRIPGAREQAHVDEFAYQGGPF